MAKSEVRKQWKDFKKKYPSFEKAKNFKADFGPQLDKLQQKCDAIQEGLKELIKQADELRKLQTSAGAASNGYETIVESLEKEADTKGILRDFRAFCAQFDDEVEKTEAVQDHLKKALAKTAK